MRVTIIGGGNIGGAIARGLSRGSFFQASDITVVDTNPAVLDALRIFNPQINLAQKNNDITLSADIIIIALKPWLIENFLESIKFQLNYDRQTIISVAAGISFKQLNEYLKQIGPEMPTLFRIIPNTAISVNESMTFIASFNASEKKEQLIVDIFSNMGKTVLISEDSMSAGTALGSCGIAYAFRYIRAATEAGVEIGFSTEHAQQIAMQTLKGAIKLLEDNKSHPEMEIDKVTTPGGITIKGLNTLEKYGFTNAVIEGIKAGNLSENIS
ncbi:MAG: pyrroline-5-carboxylate reductase [Dysgonamonadaceae bacterium]|jgi:pyrroline-5-carboxylate reductase|nr:pyrroline-5-carboxylate reductase [Dysgonamonadaceae bacterium]